MCGIAGIALKPSVTCADVRERALAMRDAMAHRGPDDAGTFVSHDERLVLVNRRLAIRDLSPLGHMPMLSADEQIAITYNGELYNADALRTELGTMGHRFRSTSDTEVILQGFAEWREAVFARLRGIFAIALYDARPHNASGAGAQLWLARDALGVKPLYYANTAAGLLFASELKALHASGLVSAEIEPSSVVAYLELGSVPTPRTIYTDIVALEPASLLCVDLASMAAETRQYWTLPTQVCAAPQDLVQETRAALVDAVRSQLVSDVPLGAFLSGGLDSSAVVALMRQATNGTLRTCAMVFDEAEYSEASYARAVAEAVGAEHFERVVTAQDVVSEMPRILWALDQPSIDGVNSYFVSQTARQAGLTVALSGLGGDELFGGYPTFYAAPRLHQQLKRIEQVPAANALARTALGWVPQSARYAKIQAALRAPASPANAYLAYRGVFAPAEVQALVTPEIWDAAHAFDPLAYITARAGGQECDDVYAWTSHAELTTYTLNQLLRDTDVMSMAHSLEVRVPLLDAWLVEKIISLPDAAKQNGGTPKSLLRKAVGDLLPDIVRERSVKQGFTFPFERWLRGDLGAYFNAFAPDAQGLLQPKAVTRVIDTYRQGKLHWSRAWSLMVMQGWMGR